MANSSALNSSAEFSYQNPTLTDFPNPPSFANISGIVLIFLMIVLCNAGGLGGGGNLTPFIVIFFGISYIESIPIGNFIGLISALSRFIINYNQKHPNNKNRVSMDYEIIELTMPILYLGTLFGV